MKQLFIRLNLSLMFLLFFSTSYGQYMEKLRSERPGKAISPFIPGKNVFQLESGFIYNKATSRLSNPDVASLVNATLFRWGLLNNLELNAAVELKKDKVNYRDTLNYINSGFSDLQVGGKCQIINGTRFSPTIAFQASVLLNVINTPYNPKNAAPTFLIMMDQTLNEKLSFLANLGLAWDGNNGSPSGVYALNLGWKIKDGLNFMFENYGALANGALDIYFDSGLSYVLEEDFQVDFSLGYGYNDGLQDVFFAIGFSWRFMGDHYYYQEFAE